MWAAVRTVPAGNPLIVARKSTVAAVMLPPLSLVMFMVMLTDPDPAVSGPTAAGVSSLGRSVALSTTLVGGAVVVGVVAELSLLPQAEAKRPRMAARTGNRDMVSAPYSNGSEELAGQIESQIETFRGAAAGELPEGGRVRVG